MNTGFKLKNIDVRRMDDKLFIYHPGIMPVELTISKDSPLLDVFLSKISNASRLDKFTNSLGNVLASQKSSIPAEKASQLLMELIDL